MPGRPDGAGTAHGRAYERIRNAIFTGRLRPGQQLTEEYLAGQFSVSRTPVRQALRLLADQGLIEIRANRRSYVADVNEAQFEEIFDLLSFLEPYSAGLAAGRMGDEAIARLKELNAAMARTRAPADNRTFLELNAEFHDLIHAHSASEKVRELLMRVIRFPHNLYLKFGQIPDAHNPSSVVEHGQIIAALESGDRAFTEVQMKAHVESVRLAFRRLWDENGNEDGRVPGDADRPD